VDGDVIHLESAQGKEGAQPHIQPAPGGQSEIGFRLGRYKPPKSRKAREPGAGCAQEHMHESRRAAAPENETGSEEKLLAAEVHVNRAAWRGWKDPNAGQRRIQNLHVSKLARKISGEAEKSAAVEAEVRAPAAGVPATRQRGQREKTLIQVSVGVAAEDFHSGMLSPRRNTDDQNHCHKEHEFAHEALLLTWRKNRSVRAELLGSRATWLTCMDAPRRSGVA